jgi:hypothetical protein
MPRTLATPSYSPEKNSERWCPKRYELVAISDASMSRTVAFEGGRFLVFDDPEHVIGTALAIITNNRNRTRIAERLAPDGGGFTIDTIDTVARVETRVDPIERGRGLPIASNIAPPAIALP